MSFNYNHITLVGRLTRDADVREVSDRTRTSFTVAVDRPYRKEDGSYDTDFIPVVAWGKLAEVAADRLKKGNPVLVQGRLQIRQYEKDEEPRWISEVLAEDFQRLGGDRHSSTTDGVKEEVLEKKK